MADWKKNISFVLIDTIEPGNIGASARALKNLGFSRLELVRPRKSPSGEAAWFAHGAEDILKRTVHHAELDQALRDKAVVIGTTRRTGKYRGPIHPIRNVTEKIRNLANVNRIAILFGKEDRGLTNDEASTCSFLIHIPADPGNPSFNLAQALLIVAYELASSSYRPEPFHRVISNEELNTLFNRLRLHLRLAGYEPKGIRDNEETIMKKLKQLLGRAELSHYEAKLLHGIISQLESKLAVR